MSDELDSALDNDDIEEEIEEEVDKVLSELAGETAAQLPAAARREHATKQADAQTEPVPEKEVRPSLSLSHTHSVSLSLIIIFFGVKELRWCECISLKVPITAFHVAIVIKLDQISPSTPLYTNWLLFHLDSRLSCNLSQAVLPPHVQSPHVCKDITSSFLFPNDYIL